MPRVVGVAFRPATKVYYFDPAGLDDLQPGERVVVETARGRTLGRVVLAPREVPESEIAGTLKPVVRRATAWDMVQSDQMAHKEAEALALCRQKAAALGLDIKIIKVEFSFDGSSALVYFRAEHRIDFRDLVQELGQALHTKVEMRQIGVRDEAKLLAGYGRCGRELCCATWLREFASVSIKMAKNQELPLNASEVSGLCGRLLCCLSYENDLYVEARARMPRLNSVVMTPEGPGKVKQVHVLRNSITVKVGKPGEDARLVEVPLPVSESDEVGGEKAKEAEVSVQPTPVAATAQAETPAQEPLKGAEEAGQPSQQPARTGRRRRPRARRRRK